MNTVRGDIRQSASSVGGSAAQMGNMAVGANAAEAGKNIDLAVLHTVYARLIDTAAFDGSFAEWLQVLADGRPIVFGVYDNHIAWRYSDQNTWELLVDLESISGSDGLSSEIAVIDGYIATRQMGDAVWTQLVALEDLIGETGKSAYQSYTETTPDDPPLTESEWASSRIAWARLTDVPDSFPPAAHDHDADYYKKDEVNTALADGRAFAVAMAIALG